MKIRNLLSSITIIAVSWVTCAHADDLNKNIFVSDAWVQAMPPSQNVSAAYMVITNNSSKEEIVVSASSERAAATEIHQMRDMNGMMHMAMTANLHIPALSKVILKPGGFHIMLINLKKPIKKGDIVPMTLHFQGGGTIMVNANVRDQ